MHMSVRFRASAFISPATACGSSSTPTYGGGGGGGGTPASCTGAGASATIDATGSLTFNPSAATIMAGQKVCWVNNSGIAHTVTSNNAGFTGGDLPHGRTFLGTFSTAGSLPPPRSNP